jgi:hypothetical protein
MHNVQAAVKSSRFDLGEQTTSGCQRRYNEYYKVVQLADHLSARSFNIW